MIYLNKNTTNTVILELTSVSSLLNPNYLFEFISDINPSSITYFTSADLSTFKCRYNRFEVIENNTSIPLSGQVSLISGSYNYNIYESSAITISVSATTGRVLSTGKVIVDGVDTNISNIYR